MNLWRMPPRPAPIQQTISAALAPPPDPGRWNDGGEPVVYCAPAIAMAVLETAAHIDDAGLPLNRFLIRIDVPDDIWVRREEMSPDKLPRPGRRSPAGGASVKVGSAWLSSKRSVLLLVPSVIVPEERTALINPVHPDAARLSAKVLRQFEYDRLFRN